MNGEGMQLSSTLHFKGRMRYRLYFQKRIKQQSLINIQEWTLNLNWSDEKFERQRIDTVFVCLVFFFDIFNVSSPCSCVLVIVSLLVTIDI